MISIRIFAYTIVSDYENLKEAKKQGRRIYVRFGTILEGENFNWPLEIFKLIKNYNIQIPLVKNFPNNVKVPAEKILFTLPMTI